MSLEKLTPRELEIARLVEQGLSNREIGRRVGCLEGTVKTHMRLIVAKMGLSNRTQLAVWMAKNGGAAE